MALGLGMGLGFGGGGASRVFVASVGVPVLPSWLSFSCASTRYPQTGLSTLNRTGVATNTPFVWSDGVHVGLLHEPGSTNYASYSEAFGSWTVDEPPGLTLGIVDPAGGTTGITVATPGPFGTNLYTPTYPTPLTAITVSSWVQPSTSPNTAIFGTVDNTDTLIPPPMVLNPVANSGWNRYSGTYVGTAKTLHFMDIGDQRMVSPANTPSNASYAFYQVEGLPYATSYIPNAGPTGVTRAASDVQFNVNSASNTTFTLRYIQAATFAASGACAFVGDGTNAIGLNSAGNLTFFGTTGSQVYAPAVGDVVDVIIRQAGTAGYVNFQMFRNGAAYLSEQLSHGGSFNFSSKHLHIGSNGISAGLYLPATMYPKLGWQ